VLQPHSFSPCPNPVRQKDGKTVNAMTVDVEEYFQVHALAPYYTRPNWEDCQSRVVENTKQILDLFQRHNTKATFFILGWVAERHPQLIRQISDEGHEVASHGMCHIRADEQSVDEFREDIRRSKALLQDASGQAVNGFRAASFSVGSENLWSFEVLAEEDYRYSSSINPVRHDHYGMPNAPRFPFRPNGHSELVEIPISTLRAFNQNLACGGGGYFRLLPYAYSKFAIGRVNKADGWPFMFYFHPWEIDPNQPRPEGVNLKSRIRHYTNLAGMEARLERLLRDFSWSRVDDVYLGE